MAEIFLRWADLDTPSLVIDREILDRNLREMQQLADRAGINLRPHIKTHKCSSLARKQVALGACGIAVAKLSEASVMIEAGLGDIQIANQIVGGHKISKLVELSERASLACAIDSLENAVELSEAFVQAGRKLSVLVEIDTGLHRCGLADQDEIGKLYAQASTLPGLSVRGIMTHAGHSYAAKNSEEVGAIGQAEGEAMVLIAENLRGAGLVVEVVSVGSTPTARHSAMVKGVTELRVGNYIFNDLIQVALGTVPIERCALTVLTTVISVGSDGRSVIDAGTKALTNETGAHGNALVKGFGRTLQDPEVQVARLSEEHGILAAGSREFRMGSNSGLFLIMPVRWSISSIRPPWLTGVVRSSSSRLMPGAARSSGSTYFRRSRINTTRQTPSKRAVKPIRSHL